MSFEDSLKKVTDRIVDGGARLDGLVNSLFGFGTDRDPTEAGHFEDEAQIPWPELSAMFHQEDIARKIVVLPPREMLRQGVEIVSAIIPQKEQIKHKAEQLDAVNAYFAAMVWGRLFGGAVIFVGADDGGHACEQLIRHKVKSVDFLQVYDRRYISIVKRYDDPRHPKYRQPEIYRLQTIYGTAAEVHESRLEIFRGAMTDQETRERLDTWDYSVLQSCYRTLRQFETVFKASEIMMRDASQGVFKMKGLMSMIAGKRIADIQTRAHLLDMTRSVARSVFLDSDGSESFEKIATQFASVDNMLDRFCNRLSAAVEIPVTLLMGQAPAGLNATGDSDIRIFYDSIKSEQEKDVKPRFRRLFQMIATSIKTDPAAVDAKFPPLWQETPKERADRRKSVAEADAIYLDREVLTPEEIAKNRFGGSDYSDETKIDMHLRLGDFLAAPPPPPGMGGGVPPKTPQAPPKAPPPPGK